MRGVRHLPSARLQPRRRVFGAVLVALAVAWTPAAGQESGAGAAGQDPERPASIHPQARRAISEIRSPYCPGLMLEVCPSPPAAVLRDSIETLARAGLTADSIVEQVIASYGEEWRAVPRRQGWGWWAWLMPPVMIVSGLLVIGVVLRRRRALHTPAPATSAREPDEREAERLREALHELDASESPDW